MPVLPEGTDRNRLVVVRPTNLPKDLDPKDVPEHVVGAAWLQSDQGAEDFEFLRFEGETQQQADEREKAAADAAKPTRTAKTHEPGNDF